MNGRAALAKAFDDWFQASGLSQNEVAAKGGPSTTSQTKVRLSDGPLARQTLNDIDLVTGWPAGTARRILDGQQVSPEVSPGIDWSQITNEELAEQVRLRLTAQVRTTKGAKHLG